MSRTIGGPPIFVSVVTETGSAWRKKRVAAATTGASRRSARRSDAASSALWPFALRSLKNAAKSCTRIRDVRAIASRLLAARSAALRCPEISTRLIDTAPASWSIRRTSVTSFSRTRRSTSASAALAANGASEPSFARSGRKKFAAGSRPARGEGDLESCRRPERASCGVRDVDVAAEVDALSGEREDWSEASIEDAEGASGSLRRRTVFAAAAAAFPAVLDPDAPIEPHPAPRECDRAGDVEGDESARVFSPGKAEIITGNRCRRARRKLGVSKCPHVWPGSRAFGRALSTRERTGDE